MVSVMLVRSRCLASNPFQLKNLHSCIQPALSGVRHSLFYNNSRQFERNVSSIRDPERPKLPATPWIRFLDDYRKQNQELKGKEVMKVASVAWKKLSEPQRSPWEKPYLIEKKTYDDNFKAYEKSGKLDQWKVQAAALKRDPEKPKKPTTPWLKFLAEYRVKHPAMKVTEVTKSAAPIWKTMTNAQKAPYSKGFEEAKAKYAAELEAYKASGKEQVWKDNKAAGAKKTSRAKNELKAAGANEKTGTKEETKKKVATTKK